jgi:hypothetical protein
LRRTVRCPTLACLSDGNKGRRRGFQDVPPASATAECTRSIRQADAVGPTLRGGIEAAEKQIGVGDRRLLAAAAVADRTGTGSRALRTDLQDAGAVDARSSRHPPRSNGYRSSAPGPAYHRRYPSLQTETARHRGSASRRSSRRMSQAMMLGILTRPRSRRQRARQQLVPRPPSAPRAPRRRGWSLCRRRACSPTGQDNAL